MSTHSLYGRAASRRRAKIVRPATDVAADEARLDADTITLARDDVALTGGRT